MKKNSLFLFSPWFMGVLFVVFAFSMATATFIENDFGAAIAAKWVYGSKWFELILLLLVVNLLGQIFINKLLNQKKLAILLFHLSFILIIIGAGITRYFGFDGSIHIRAGESQNICSSSEKHIQFSILDNTGKQIFRSEKSFVITPSSVDKYSKEVVVENTPYSLKLVGFIPNAVEALVDDEGGTPIVSLMLTSGMMGRQTIFLKEGEIKEINGSPVGFCNKDSLDAKITCEKDSFYIQSSSIISTKNMMNQETSIHEIGEKITLKPMMIYNFNKTGFVVQKLSSKGIMKPIYHQPKQGGHSQTVLEFELKTGEKKSDIYLWVDKDPNGTKATYSYNGNTIDVAYGPKEVELPFEIKLNKFVLERYPGSNSPSSYKSEVTLIDKEHNVEKSYSIYMNHILKYRGYRFFQSSYDTDEKGTVLSVNHDKTGMVVTYIGYMLLFIFIILSIINKNSLLKTITINAWKSPVKKGITTLLAIFLSTTLSYGIDEKLVIDKNVADNFGRVLVQDQKGRTKPLFTLSNDIIRKVTKKNQFEGYSSMQVFLGFYADFNSWKNVPLIKVSNSDLAKNIGVNGDYAAFTDVVDVSSNSYKLAKLVEEAYTKPEGSRNKFDKEIIKLDERVNILYMIYTGEFLKIFPIKDKSTKWGSPTEAIKYAESKEDSLYLANIMSMIIESAQHPSSSNNTIETDKLISSIVDYQKKFAGYNLPSERKVNLEVFYNKAKIFEKLFPFYATIGLILIFTLIFGIVSGKVVVDRIIKYLSILLLLGFVAHTIGLILRWYISGHAPMSNGYESMLFISWATLLAGFIFSKKSNFALSATAVLSSLTLLVAHLSFMDPEITNLVPVLKSYWLTLHVSIITGSYGFLGLGAVLGLLVMILYSLRNAKNNERINKTIDELTIVNYKTLTLGLYFLTIGTFLGAVWANESWGRYWGWDPKETWSLITMIIYSIVIHSRMIKPLRSVYTFNLLSLFAFSSVLMTYFGVNYYLSGLHSYASGDPIPVPTFVYITVFALISLSFFALIKYKQGKVAD
ncbi:MAG: c-type cytochrome biogenesis protein CcsB [Bacteroidales bacterium]|nr:c-type cytochrome biogenesis protein CcsB [Bacteroidales bacterium]